MNNFTVLINSTDSFEDCWIPFFTLFKKFWPEYNGKIYLNTETKIFTFGGLNIIPVQNNIKTPHMKITWSECLIRALKMVDSEIILYMQEDYFLKDSVKNNLVEKYAQLMKEHEDIHCIHLTDQAVKSEMEPSNYDGLYPVVLKQSYRICCQAALWRKDILLSYLRPYENAWQFEEFGSKRSAKLAHNFLVVDNNWIKLNQFEIIPYIFTGIFQGRWYKEVVPLFSQNNIQIDYTRRGFTEDANPKPLSLKIKQQWRRIPVLLRNELEIWRLKTQKKNLTIEFY